MVFNYQARILKDHHLKQLIYWLRFVPIRDWYVSQTFNFFSLRFVQELTLYNEDVLRKPKILVFNKMDSAQAEENYRLFCEKSKTNLEKG